MTQATTQIVDALDRSKLHFVEVDGIRTRYYMDGTGQPLLIFSGGQFASLYSLDAFSLNLPELAKDLQVYGVDKLGQGHTDNPKSDAEYTFDSLYNHTYRLIQTLGVTSCILMGHSRGALLVAWLALEHPELVKKLVLVDTDTLGPEIPMFPSGSFYVNLPVHTGPPTLESVLIEPAAQAFRKEQLTDDFAARLLEIAQLPNFQVAERKMVELGPSVWMPSLNPRRLEAIRRIEDEGFRMPTLLIWGANDRSASLPKGLQLFERIAAKTPQAEMHLLNDAGHYTFRDQYEAFNQIVRDFCLD